MSQTTTTTTTTNLEDPPYHTSIPAENVFAGKIVGKDAFRAAGLVESYLLTGVRRAQTFKPRSSDVFLISGPCSGEDSFGRMLATLVADNPMRESTREVPWTLPWIESRYAEMDFNEVENNCFSNTKRVLRTQMTFSMLDPRQNFGPKFIVLIRHPIDMRASFFDYIKLCSQIPTSGKVFEFEESFPSADSFCDVPVTLCQMSTAEPASYEQLIADWLRLDSHNPDVLLVCYEAFISNPVRETRRVAAFLQKETKWLPGGRLAPSNAQEEQEIVLDKVRIEAALAAANMGGGDDFSNNKSKRKSTRLTNALRRISVSVKRRASRAMTSRSSQSRSNGVSLGYLNNGASDGKEGQGSSCYEKSGSIRKMLGFWELKIEMRESYEKLYEAKYNEPYPYPQINSPLNIPNQPKPDFKQDVSRVVNIARGTFSNLRTKFLKNKGTDSDFDNVAAVTATATTTTSAPLSILKPKTNNRHVIKTEEEALEELTRDYSSSIIPSQAFGDAGWTASSTLKKSSYSSNGDNNNVQEPDDDDPFMEAENDETLSPSTQQMQQSQQLPPQQPRQNLELKFATQQVFEANMLRNSMKNAGIPKPIVDVVTDSSNLSEML